MTEEDRKWVESIQEKARRDDWHLTLVGSDVRRLCGMLLGTPMNTTLHIQNGDCK